MPTDLLAGGPIEWTKAQREIAKQALCPKSLAEFQTMVCSTLIDAGQTLMRVSDPGSTPARAKGGEGICPAFSGARASVSYLPYCFLSAVS